MRKVRIAGRRTPRSAAGLAWLPLALAACEVEWGGAYLALEDPAPAPDTTFVAEPERPVQPLPEGPLLYAARIRPSGSARLVPVARLGSTLSALELPESLGPDYRARFDSTFLGPGRELSLLSGGRRIGTLVLTGGNSAPSAACPSVADATVLLLPGQAVPAIGFGLPPTAVAGAPDLSVAVEPSRAMVVAGPVLAERLIDDERAFLARRVALRSVPAETDTLPWMAATYLVSDSLAPGPPAGNAISLFFLARYMAGRGYSAIWQEVRRYDSPDRKEAFEYLDWLRTTAGRLDLLRRYGGDRVVLAGSFLPTGSSPDSRSVGWTETGGCRALELLEAG